MRQKRARWVLIFGLLAGLFFSGGEGIRLMPFPVSEIDNSKIAETSNAGIGVSALEENSKSYAFSVFSSRSFSAFLKAKFQKNTNQYLSGEHYTFERRESRANFSPRFACQRQEADFPRVSPFTESQPGRAPPAI